MLLYAGLLPFLICVPGPIIGYKVHGVEAQLHDLHITYGTSMPMVTAALAHGFVKALKAAKPVLLEPVMTVEVDVGDDYLGQVLQDLSKRRGQITEVTMHGSQHMVKASAPLAELRGYATALRIMTSGTASVSMLLDKYCHMGEKDQIAAIQETTGFYQC